MSRPDEEYVPLRQAEDGVYDSEVNANGESADPKWRPSSSPPLSLSHAKPDGSFWLAVALAVLSVVSSLLLFHYTPSADLNDPRNIASLKKLLPYPHFDMKEEINKARFAAQPKMMFTRSTVAVDSGTPDEVKKPSPSIRISSTGSTFYEWVVSMPNQTSCYIGAFVSTAEALKKAGKSDFTSTGDISALEVWNVSAPHAFKRGFSWNTRPQRLNLMGTLNFTRTLVKYEGGMYGEPYVDEDGDTVWPEGKELKPPTPLFDCSGKKRLVTVEIACKGCTLEWEQIFSDPALSIDVEQIG